MSDDESASDSRGSGSDEEAGLGKTQRSRLCYVAAGALALALVAAVAALAPWQGNSVRRSSSHEQLRATAPQQDAVHQVREDADLRALASPQPMEQNLSAPALANTCAEGEEELGGLCYTKCATLAPGFPHRGSPWTCCMDHPCNMGQLDRIKADIGHLLCSGFAVGGADGKDCPQRHGLCLDDEEMHAGLCYKRCDLLTNGEYPHRTAAATCCKDDSLLFCLMRSKTRHRFNLGSIGSGAPHPPATSKLCLMDEELFDNLCFKRCSVLTDSRFPHRASPITCCRKEVHASECQGDGGESSMAFNVSISRFDQAGGSGAAGPRDPLQHWARNLAH